MELGRKLCAQKRDDKNKIYSIHAPEAECIAKGKGHKKYEFGCKTSVAASSRDNFVLGMLAEHGSPYDGHTLSGAVEQVERLSGRKVGEVFVDKGYRGHDYTGSAIVHVARDEKVERGITQVDAAAGGDRASYRAHQERRGAWTELAEGRGRRPDERDTQRLWLQHEEATEVASFFAVFRQAGCAENGSNRRQAGHAA
jgi:IS5 family transposase